MSKELDYLDKILNYQPLTLVERTIIECIKEKIQRLESIDNANPSEALECLEYIENKLKDLEYIAKKNDNEYLLSKYIPSEKFNSIKQALLKAQEPKQYVDELKLVEKSLKALEIIKEKRIDIESFYTSFIEGEYDYDFYERRYGTYGKYCLTQEEFNLLKEVLE